ncbi:MAG: RNA-directed DNA polymerase [Saccharofermentans sp.]|nr:RNA-directed DNA polymerase [Saccharofermentans sp.]
MNLNNIERNQLDYILTDVLPTELSELFSYRYFYEYLDSKHVEIDKIIKLIIKKKNKNTLVFNGNANWVSIPLSYTIMKQLHSERLISLLHPLGAMQLFLFIAAYQKEMLSILQKNSMYSLRYHKKNNSLIYKNTNKSVSKYFPDLSESSDKEIIEQTGMFFAIGPYKSLATFTSSEEWYRLNSKYKYFIRTDYKACFDSIYTHTFNWIIGKDVNDTKYFNNGSVYSAIDRILMNINARTSNGIVVGPEFSRMVAEILLQSIDKDVFCKLLSENYRLNENYNIYRYVDDVFIFAESEELANRIFDHYSDSARKYLLYLNERKLIKSKVPFVLEPWLSETNLFANRASSLLFYSNDEQDIYSSEHQTEQEMVSASVHLLKPEKLSNIKKSFMNQFNELICKYETKDKTIVAYLLGTILKTFERKKENVRIFKENISEKELFDFLDLAMYIYSFFPNFTNTERLLSIISYIKDEVDIFSRKKKLQQLIDRYAFVFEKANLNDIINLVLFCYQAKIEIPFRQEKAIEKQLYDKDDPVLWASYLLYSQYSQNYYQEIRNKIGSLLTERINAIVKKDAIYTYREFWWVLIFNKSPHLLPDEQTLIDNIIPNTSPNTDNNPGAMLGNIFIDFLRNNPEQFFEWDINRIDFLRKLTFKTRQRTIFRNYQENLSALEWSSI